MSDPQVYEWMALRRVREGGVAKSAGAYLDHGRPTAGHLAGVFDRLIWTGLVTVAEGDPLWELRRLSLTDAGVGRYAALSGQRRDSPQAPAPEHGTQTTIEAPADRWSSVGPLAPPGDQPDTTLPSPTDREARHRG